MSVCLSACLSLSLPLSLSLYVCLVVARILSVSHLKYSCIVALTEMSVSHPLAEEMSRVMRKTVFGVSDQVRHKPDCAATEDGYRLRVQKVEGLDYLCSETKGAEQMRGLICALICAFTSRFSHDAAQYVHVLIILSNTLGEKTPAQRNL